MLNSRSGLTTNVYNSLKLGKTDDLIHLQEKIGYSSKKIEQSQQYLRILTQEN